MGTTLAPIDVRDQSVNPLSTDAETAFTPPIATASQLAAASLLSPGAPTSPNVRLSEILGALSTALDITEGQPAGHAVRTCGIGMKLAELLDLPADDRSALFYALLLKDLGCSSNASKMCYLFGSDDRESKREVKTANLDHIRERVNYILRRLAPTGSISKRVGTLIKLGIAGPREAKQLVKMRCERGASIARMFGLPNATAEAIRSLDEHWDGRGHPVGLRGEEIPLLARILGLAQTVEVFLKRDGIRGAMNVARERRGTWFDPQLVDALLTLENDTRFWTSLMGAVADYFVADFEPEDQLLTADDAMIDRICFGFAQVVDAKSPWTARHSEGVAQIAVGIAQQQGLSLDDQRILRRVGLMHDIGKLGVSNMILDKQGPLTEDEFKQMRQHPALSQRILNRIGCLRELADLAGSHHERMDGKGYYRGLNGRDLSDPARALVVADMYEAMSANRPYRKTMSQEKVLSILENDTGTAVCGGAVEGLKGYLDEHGYEPSGQSEI